MADSEVLAERTLWTPYRDGARPVQRKPDPAAPNKLVWEVGAVAPGQAPQVFNSNTELMVALTGHPQGRHWSPERFFQVGRQRGDETVLFDLFPPTTLTTVSGTSLAPTLAQSFDLPHTKELKPRLRRQERGFVTLAPTAVTVVGEVFEQFARGFLTPVRRRPVQVHEGLGIDLARRGHEVAKLMYAGFGRRIFAAGYDPDDVLQEVYKGILARNAGKCPWDPKKSSFGHYVHMVIGCVLSNYHRKQHRTAEIEQVGIRSWTDGESQDVDVGALAHRMLSCDSSQEDALLGADAELGLVRYLQEGTRGQVPEAKLALQAIPYLRDGWSRGDIARHLAVTVQSISRALTWLRTHTRSWIKTL